MRRRAAAARAREREQSSLRGPIGFAVRDVAGRGSAFEIDVAAGEALVFGSSSPLRVSAQGVLPAHFVVLPHDGVLVAASASAATPAILNGSPLPTTWTVLAVPSRIRVGAAAVDFFYVRESGVVLVDLDVETTVADPGASSGATRIESGRRAKLTTPPRPLPPLLPPPMRGAARVAVPRQRPLTVVTEAETEGETLPHVAFGGASTSGVRPAQSPLIKAHDLALLAYSQLRLHWNTASMSTRVLLGVVGVLLLFLLARSGQPPRSLQPGDDAGARVAAAPPTFAPPSIAAVQTIPVAAPLAAAPSAPSAQAMPAGVPVAPVMVVPQQAPPQTAP